MYTFSTFW